MTDAVYKQVSEQQRIVRNAWKLNLDQLVLVRIHVRFLSLPVLDVLSDHHPLEAHVLYAIAQQSTEGQLGEFCTLEMVP